MYCILYCRHSQSLTVTSSMVASSVLRNCTVCSTVIYKTVVSHLLYADSTSIPCTTEVCCATNQSPATWWRHLVGTWSPTTSPSPGGQSLGCHIRVQLLNDVMSPGRDIISGPPLYQLAIRSSNIEPSVRVQLSGEVTWAGHGHPLPAGHQEVSL